MGVVTRGRRDEPPTVGADARPDEGRASTADSSPALARGGQQIFEQLFNKAAVPLCFINKETGKLHFNERFTETFGYSRDEIPTLDDWFRLAYPDSAYRAHVLKICGEAIENALENDTDLEPIEYRVTCKSGEVRDMVVSGSVIGDDWLLTFFEVTERKRAEEQVRQLNQRLEQRIRDRTAELEAANRDLEAFAYSVSHDLRAPLRHVDGFVEMLRREVRPSAGGRGEHYMKRISTAVSRMEQLIDDLLSFSRMSRVEMTRQPVELRSLVRDVVAECQADTVGRDVHWTVAEIPAVCGDRAMLRVVLSNLVSNAVKFTGGRSSALIEIGGEHGEGDEVVVFVRDNGVGFDQAHAEEAFGVFQRLCSAEDFEGTGIGLANVRRIIARHGGRTWAEGVPGEGATFFFSLPRSRNGACAA